MFTTQMERTREATDLSRVSTAFAEAAADYLESGAYDAKTAKVTNVKQMLRRL